MDMPYGLGIDLGTSFTTGAISRAGAGRSKLEIVSLGSSTPAVASMLYLAEDGWVLVGEAAERRVLTEPERVYRGFARPIGDDVLTSTADAPSRPEALAAWMVQWVVKKVAKREGELAERIVVASPAGWDASMRERLGQELIEFELENLIFVSQPGAAVAGCDTMERVELGSAFAVYDLGGGSFKAAVIRKTGEDEFTTLGAPHVTERLGGAHFDEAVLSHVVTELGDQVETVDIHNPAVLTAMAQLLAECGRAKEDLSTDTEVAIPILLPGVQPQVRLHRSQFEAMIRPALLETVHGLRTALSSARVRTADLSAVLLVGGCSRIPLVAELISAALRRPVVVPPYPQMAVARGAALVAAPGRVHGLSISLPLPVRSSQPEAPPPAMHQAGKVLAAAIISVALGAVPLAIAQLDGASTPADSPVWEAFPDAQGEGIQFGQGVALPQQAGTSNGHATQDRDKQPPATPAMAKPAAVKPAAVKLIQSSSSRSSGFWPSSTQRNPLSGGGAGTTPGGESGGGAGTTPGGESGGGAGTTPGGE
ncbi:MAG: Hsp70 family protein, partial [Actinomycetota bacterium]|nr:Hsp70 family protein [Actinomycetota bacterium]